MDAFERAARREMVDGPRIGFRIHLAVYVAVQLLLIGIWALSSVADGQLGHPWFVYPLLGWGIGLAAHYMAQRSLHRRESSRREPPSL